MTTLHLDTTNKRLTALRYYLQGTKFTLAQNALELAKELHSGTRKDDVTPEWAHPISVTLYLVTMVPTFGQYAEQILTASLLHDVLEDTHFSERDMRAQFGDAVTGTVLSVTHKLYLDPKFVIDKAEHFRRMASDLGGGILKAADRINNQNTMVGVFNLQKIIDYVYETRTYILPMLKRSCRLHPNLMMALQNARLLLESQCDLLDAVIAGQQGQQELNARLLETQRQNLQ